MAARLHKAEGWCCPRTGDVVTRATRRGIVVTKLVQYIFNIYRHPSPVLRTGARQGCIANYWCSKASSEFGYLSLLMGKVVARPSNTVTCRRVNATSPCGHQTSYVVLWAGVSRCRCQASFSGWIRCPGLRPGAPALAIGGCLLRDVEG